MYATMGRLWGAKIGELELPNSECSNTAGDDCICPSILHATLVLGVEKSDF